MSWAAIGGAAIGAVGSYMSSKQNAKAAAAGQNQNGTQTGTTSTALDPRIAQILGMGGDGGILGGLAGSLGSTSLLPAIGRDFVSQHANDMFNQQNAAATALMYDQYKPPGMEAARVEAPSQNTLDLKPSYDRFINGTPGANPYLDQSINGAIAQNRLGFQQLMDDSNSNLLKNILPSIRGGAIAAGQYGGTRQGIAEGNAIGQQQQELARAGAQFGQNATNAAVNAKAGAYDADSNRALSATQGLGAQQYAVAQQDAAARQAADIANMAQVTATRGLNNQAREAGIGAQQNVLNTAATGSNFDLSRLGMTSSVLAPFLNAGATTNVTNNTTGNVAQPLFQSTAGNVIGGGLMGAQLGGMLKNGSATNGGSGFGGMFGGLFGGGNSGGLGSMSSLFSGMGNGTTTTDNVLF